MIIYAIILSIICFFVGKFLRHSIDGEFKIKNNYKYLAIGLTLISLIVGLAYPYTYSLAGLFAYWGGNVY